MWVLLNVWGQPTGTDDALKYYQTHSGMYGDAVFFGTAISLHALLSSMDTTFR